VSFWGSEGGVTDSACPHWAIDIAVGSIAASVAEEKVKLKTPTSTITQVTEW
jgi:hypothetical protein